MPSEIAERLGEYLLAGGAHAPRNRGAGLVAKGLGNKQIAQTLGTAAGTVKMHVQNILAKLRASDRTHAVTLGLQRDIIRIDA